MIGVTKVPFRGASELRRARRDGDGWVYLSTFSFRGAKVYKVGMTYQPRTRPYAGKFESSNPFGARLELIDTKLVWFEQWIDAKAFEQSVLVQYEAHLVHGEWLRFNSRYDEQRMLEDFRDEEQRSVAARRQIGVDAAIARAADQGSDRSARVVSHDLVGWEQISKALGVSRATAVRWSKRRVDRLPVGRFGGRVVARSGDLGEWYRRQKNDTCETA